MKRRPLVGIGAKLARENGDTVYKLDRNYVRCVERAGGTPLILPFFRTRADARAFLDRLDAVVMTGGDDPDPRRWGERRHPKMTPLLPEREKSDYLVTEEALRRDLPLLAVCCGAQILNIALGGDIHQHLYDLPGIRKHSGGVRHAVAVGRGTRLADLIGPRAARVNSYHHQACRKPGRGIVFSAGSDDGVVEALESTRHRFAIGIQWHPERMVDDRRQQKLFRALVAEARR